MAKPVPSLHGTHGLTPAVVRRVRSLWKSSGPSAEMLLEGPHLLYEALDAHVHVSSVWFTHEALRREGTRLGRACAHAEHTGATVTAILPTALARMSPTRTPSGVLAIAQRPTPTEGDTLTPHPPLVVIAAGLQDPGNLGAVVRVVEAAGGTGVWITDDGADPYGWRALRGSMGSAIRLPIVRYDAVQSAIVAAAARGLQVVATQCRTVRSLYDVDYRQPTAFLLGSEGAGLSAAAIDRASVTVAIPMAQQVDSLNVSTAAAVLLYEARRQRAHGRTP